jgi:hypothetical protein
VVVTWPVADTLVAPPAASMAAMPSMSPLGGTALTVNQLPPEAGKARGFATLCRYRFRRRWSCGGDGGRARVRADAQIKLAIHDADAVDRRSGHWTGRCDVCKPGSHIGNIEPQKPARQ